MDRKRIIAGLALGLMLTGGLSAGQAAAAGAAPAQAGVHPTHSTQTMPAALRPAFYQALAKDTGKAQAIDKAGCASLPRQKLKACFDAGGAHFKGATGLALRLTAWGRGSDLASVSQVNPRIRDNHVAYRHGALTEWWRVLPMGFEQGFTIAKRPVGHGKLVLALTASRPTRHSGERRQRPSVLCRPTVASTGRDKRSIPGECVSDAGAPESGTVAWGKLRYGKLVVTDANGKVVPATLKSKGERILIAVNDAHAAYPLTVDPLVWIQEQKIIASDGASADEFGTAVSVQGTTALVGAPQGPVGPGAVYVFTYAQGKWSQTQKLVALDGVTGDYFGAAVALDGSSALIGAFDADVGCGGEGGHLYVFTESGGNWAETQEFDGCGMTGGLGVSGLGSAIAVDGDTALVGAEGADNTFGTAYLFTRAASGLWSVGQRLDSPENGGSHFGCAVALDGKTALIGAHGSNGLDDTRGKAYIFAESNGTWVKVQELDASDASDYDSFGNAVALEGDTALVGANNNFDENKLNELGAVYVFNRSGSTWTQTQELRPNDDDHDSFGSAVALRGNIAVIGAPSAYGKEIIAGAAYVFIESNGSWTQQAKLIASDGLKQDSLGYSVAFDGSNAILGAREATVHGVFDTGAAYLFGLASLDLAVSAPASVAQGSGYVAQTIATNTSSASSPEIKTRIPVPAAATLVSATATQGSCSEKKGVVTCDFGAIAGNGGTAKANVKLKAIGAKGTTILNKASVVHATPALSASAATRIEAPNTPPVAKDGTLTTNENKAASGTLQASDADGDPLTFGIVAKPKHGTVKLDNASKGTYTYTPDQGYGGADSFTFKANDGKADSNTAKVSITVNANQPPVAKDGSLTTDENKAANGTLSASDSDGDPLVFSIVAQPKHGKVTLDDASQGSYTYTPDQGYSGSDSFTFKANDGQADSNTAKVSITVKKVSSSGGGGGNAPLGLGFLTLVAGLVLWMRRRRQTH